MNTHRLFCCLSLHLLLLSASPSWAEALPTVEAAPLRDFGYVIGDRVEQRFSVSTLENNRLEPGYLPRPGPVDEGLELADIAWQSRPVANGVRLDFRIVYQVFKGVREDETVTIPSFLLHFAGNPPQVVASPESHFTLHPLIPARTPDDQVVIRNVLALLAAPSPDLRRIAVYGAVFLLALGGLAVRYGWLRFLRRTPLPFACALRECRRTQHETDGRLLLRRLHGAFNATAGYSLGLERLDAFLIDHPAFKPLDAEIRWFFACSEQTFFASSVAEVPVERLIALCRACQQAERIAP